jgi:hypothetical protein
VVPKHQYGITIACYVNSQKGRDLMESFFNITNSSREEKEFVFTYVLNADLN